MIQRGPAREGAGAGGQVGRPGWRLARRRCCPATQAQVDRAGRGQGRGRGQAVGGKRRLGKAVPGQAAPEQGGLREGALARKPPVRVGWPREEAGTGTLVPAWGCPMLKSLGFAFKFCFFTHMRTHTCTQKVLFHLDFHVTFGEDEDSMSGCLQTPVVKGIEKLIWFLVAPKAERAGEGASVWVLCGLHTPL